MDSIVNTDTETRIRRFEQQLAAFEKLHAGELKDFEQKLATYMRLHADEVRLLREELARLKKAIEIQVSSPDPTHSDPSTGEESSHNAMTHLHDKPKSEETGT